jgi:hypothetical protein
MFESIVNQNISPDIYLLDGRIQDDDISLLLKLQAENSLFFS